MNQMEEVAHLIENLGIMKRNVDIGFYQSNSTMANIADRILEIIAEIEA